MTLLSIKNLSIKDSANTYIKNISFTLEEGQTLALVGSSGSGKTLTALAIMGLLPPNFKAEGEILYGRKNLLKLSEAERRLIRASEISYTLQNSGALNPALKIKRQLIESNSAIDYEGAIKLVKQVGLAAEVLNLYPHQLSGGMRQRILLAIALTSKPKILIADEPTSGLDTTIAAQILDLLDELKSKNKLSLILITHDMGIVFQHADKIAVMYQGRIVGQGHPYAKTLLESAVLASGRK